VNRAVEAWAGIDAPALLQHVRQQSEEMTRFLSDLVRHESPSDDPHAQHAIFDVLTEALIAAGYAATRIAGRTTGGALYARPRSHRRGRPVQLLLGHCDTVWPQGTLEQMPLEVREGSVHGPGTYDMKAGLVQMVYALRVLAELDLAPSVMPIVFVNSDEEIGSRETRRHIRRLARVAERTLVLEPSLGPEGRLKTERKGVGRFTVTIAGTAAHAGLDPGKGASAIVELSHVIQRLHALNDIERGITVNVGMIEGGVRPNVVAAASRAVVDVRVRTAADVRYIEREIAGLEAVTPGVTLRIEGAIGRPPMEATPRNQALWRLAQAAGRQLGIELEQGAAGGGSDGNHTSLLSATLDGLGAVGDGAHAQHEHVVLDKMVERTALLVLILMAAPLGTAPAADAVRADARLIGTAAPS
jgi:glutamate carboxypeptidase